MLQNLTIAKPKGVYVGRPLLNKDQFIQWCKSVGFSDINEDLHVTITYSKKNFKNVTSNVEQVVIPPSHFTAITILGDATVLLFTSNQLYKDHQDKIALGATSDYPLYTAHMSISYSHQFIDCPLPDFDLVFGEEVEKELNEDYVEQATTVSCSIVPTFI